MVQWTFVELDEVGSTQAVAKGLAAMGAPEGTTVVAKSQSSGEGRLGRTWISPPGGLYISFILRPGALSRPELVTLVSTVAVAQGITRATGLAASVRWPNDVMAGGKKLAGVIAEAQSYKGEVNQIIVGVGVNCNAPGLEGLEGVATTLEEELGKRVVITELKHAVLESFSQLYDRWKGGENLMPLWRDRVATIGKGISIKLKTEETAFSCNATGIDADGSLLVTKDGRPMVVHPEDLEWLREED